jgi:RNA polymerase sigma-70 factor (ECF subfamily)
VGRVHAFAWRRVGSRAAAEDVTAATFEKAWKAFPRFRPRDGGASAWLLRIAANECTDHVRRERRLRPAALPAASVGPDELVEGDDPDLRAALDRIRPRYAEALSLRYLADLSNTEAAAALGCSASTFAVVLHRAADALRKELSHG